MNKENISKTLQFILALLVYIAFIAFVIIRVSSANFDIGRVLSYSAMLRKGIITTLIISGYSLLFGLILGFILYIARESKIYFIKSLSNIFIETIMGTPLIVLVFITSFFIGKAFNTNDDFLLGILTITAYIGPYMSNMFKSAIDGLDKDQFIVMDLYGFTKFQRYRYIIAPQIIRLLMPPLMNNLSYTIKGSSLLYLTAVTEIFYTIKLIQSQTFAFTEGYLVLWVSYLMITLPLTMITKYVERRFAL